MTRLTRQFKHHENNRSYTRKFRKNIRHVDSFVDRDFKQLIQILPVIIANEYTDVVADHDILLLNEPLKVLARLCSLVFVRKIDSNVDDYIESVKTSVEELTKVLYEFDTLTNNSKPFSTRPKVHYLHHLHEDICRFGCALQFETEKGEMFNKFIREQLFHTNRHTPSRDVAIRFGKQELLKHIIDGESWINKENKRTKYGNSIKEFFLRDEETFCLKFFGAREYAENILISKRNQHYFKDIHDLSVFKYNNLLKHISFQIVISPDLFCFCV
ncbi:MAG: hypothetical protein EXX96DRAFT_375753 [Benjaminiella poitrasii]|nr:MAG: hypothetical protein EXX96DRAFT_375753 [Benjaminiella poitrasii]